MGDPTARLLQLGRGEAGVTTVLASSACSSTPSKAGPIKAKSSSFLSPSWRDIFQKIKPFKILQKLFLRMVRSRQNHLHFLALLGEKFLKN
jgi:hypothetical protein